MFHNSTVSIEVPWGKNGVALKQRNQSFTGLVNAVLILF
jgi:hypothetical protein